MPILSLYEAYIAGDIDLAPSSSDLLTALYERDGYARYVIEWPHVVFFFTKFIPELLSHTRSQDVEQVREHYDRGDDFYAAFLGESMIYTSAIFNDEEETLEQAQVNKLNLVAHKIHLQPGDMHLDLGCGWGTLIHHFASQYGSHSTGITLGKNQTEWANAKCRQSGVQDRARALCMDYRGHAARHVVDGQVRQDHLPGDERARGGEVLRALLLAGVRHAGRRRGVLPADRGAEEGLAVRGLQLGTVHGQVHLPGRRRIVPHQVSRTPSTQRTHTSQDTHAGTDTPHSSVRGAGVAHDDDQCIRLVRT